MNESARRYHLHVGLGRLGLGLVLGLIRTDVPVIIIQRTSEEWDKRRPRLNGRGTLGLSNYVGLNRSVKVRWIDNNSSAIQKELESPGSHSYLLIYSQLSDLDWITGYCSSMTTSIGEQEEIEDWLSRSSVSGGMTIYPFENKITLTGSKSKNTVRRVMPDRICPDYPEFMESGNSMRVRVEQYAQVVFNAPASECKELFSMDGPVNVISTESERLFDYYYHRKRRLVNGLHFDVATFGYQRLLDLGVRTSDWKTQYLTILIESILNDRSQKQHFINVLIGAQAMTLVFEADALPALDKPKVFLGGSKEQLYMRLCEYGMSSLERFRNVTDRIDRVLRLDKTEKLVENYREHVSELRKFIDNYRKGVDEFPARLKPWAAEICQVVEVLTDAEHNVWAVLPGVWADLQRKDAGTARLP